VDLAASSLTQAGSLVLRGNRFNGWAWPLPGVMTRRPDTVGWTRSTFDLEAIIFLRPRHLLAKLDAADQCWGRSWILILSSDHFVCFWAKRNHLRVARPSWADSLYHPIPREYL